MTDLIDDILAQASDPAGETGLLRKISEYAVAIRSSAGRGNRSLVAEAEAVVRADPAEAFVFDSAGGASLTVADCTWQAGHFRVKSIGRLAAAARERKDQRAASSSRPRLRLWVFDGASPVTDIGSLQAAQGSDTLFQVASQFNCLESPGEYVTQVSNYFHDPTQGPRASISAFPATLLRHYAAPGPNGERFVQESGGPQIDLLMGACGPGFAPDGYLTGRGIEDPVSLMTALETRFDEICVGVHKNAQVVLGYDWDGAVEDSSSRLINQVFTSTVAGGFYSGEHNLGAAFEPVCRLLLRAAYLGTLLAAVEAGNRRVVLTLIGGGVFGNPINSILEAIERALREVEPLLSQDLEVIINGHNLGSRIDLQMQVLPLARNWGGAILRFDAKGCSDIIR